MIPPPRRRRPWKWLAAVLLATVGLAGGVIVFEMYRTQKAWADACAEADRLDPGWRWQDLLAARPVAPDDRGVSARVLEITESLPAGWPDWAAILRNEDVPAPPPPRPVSDVFDGPIPPGEVGTYDPASPEDWRRHCGEAAVSRLSETASNKLLPGSDLAALRIGLASADGALNRVNGLETLSTGRLNRVHAATYLWDTLPRHQSEARKVVRLLRVQAQLFAQDGQPDAALADVRRIFAIARSHGAEPSFMSHLVQMADRAVAVSTLEHVLGQSEPSIQSLADLQNEIWADLSEPAILAALRGERAYIEDTVRALSDGRMTYDDIRDLDAVPKLTGYRRIDEWIHRLRGGGPWSKRATAESVRYFNFLIEIAKESPDHLRTRADEIASYRAAMTPPVAADMGSYDKYIVGDRRSRALLASTAVALAAEQFRRERNRWPETIAELVAAKLISSVPDDPFDGQPLRLRRLADGLVVYSVGQDLVDGGGDVWIDKNIPGLSKDSGVRLWDVDHRRLPNR